MPYQLGKDQAITVGGIGDIKSVKLNVDGVEIDVTRRGIDLKQYQIGHKDVTISIESLLPLAAQEPNVGDKVAVSVGRFTGYCVVKSCERGEELEDAVKISTTLRPTPQ